MDVSIQTDHVIEYRIYCSRTEGQQHGTLDRYRSAWRQESRGGAGESG